MARREVKLRPLGFDDKPQVIHQLRGRIYFEMTITASSASTSRQYCKPTLPFSFVRNHGDKVRGSASLRMESCTVSWPVNVGVCKLSPTSAQVRFCAGWRSFAISNGLLEGDQLIFELTAMSEFKVYVFRSTEPPYTTPPPLKQRKRTCRSNRSLEKTNKQNHAECRDERLGGDDEESAGVSNGWAVLRRKHGAANDSSFIPGSPSPCPGEGLNHRPSFKQTLSASNVCIKGYASLEIPASFWRMYGNRIHSVVQLQGIREHSPVQTMACFTSRGILTRHYLRADWRAFVTEHELRVGQILLFTLAADSYFVVRDRSARNLIV